TRRNREIGQAHEGVVVVVLHGLKDIEPLVRHAFPPWPGGAFIPCPRDSRWTPPPRRLRRPSYPPVHPTEGRARRHGKRGESRCALGTDGKAVPGERFELPTNGLHPRGGAGRPRAKSTSSPCIFTHGVK